MKKIFAALSSIALMVFMSFSMFNAPALALPQNLADWCVTTNGCEVLTLGPVENKFVAKALVSEDKFNEATEECFRNDGYLGSGNLDMEDDWRQYFTTDHGLYEYTCQY